VGKLLILPMKKTVETIDLPDMTLTLVPGATLPPDTPPVVITPTPVTPPVVPPIVVPHPVAPPVGGFNPAVIVIKDELPWDHRNDPTPVSHAKDSLTFHWEGSDPLSAQTDEEVRRAITGIAISHIAKQWAPGVYGNGIMYHEVIAPSGTSFVVRDYLECPWHCGDPDGNNTSRAILVYCSAATAPTDNQFLAIRKRVADFAQSMGHAIPVFPHSKWTATQCPGDAIRSVIGW
jgi:hypothetical protein